MHKQVVKLPLCSTDCVGLNTGVRVVARFVAGAVRVCVCVCCVSLYRTAFFNSLGSKRYDQGGAAHSGNATCSPIAETDA